ncbi:cAMP-binding and CBS domain-containing putative signal-transduction protein [Desulfocapsa sulfexigens DSM 10523]|uniref:cAMP-binding and CBS domain-containing putative signal-transduction protein n=1 Tax=Desulfocapsa sulfexigens (strain DSM 10523 / SB164P1) TaxID=1167006 RepID=M1PA56_DESSD|nr:CBS domain-containing protein [Desulfocapsa sulfexigens]AGF78507.1 cAMP-binding and CBS domain-containing putative signal-transduction protein [Desulfocapsa sulfexigens DSM 10523]
MSEGKKIIRAEDVLEKKVVFIDGMATSRDAAAKMRSEKCRCLLVEKRHPDDAWGIVVVQDFIKGVLVAGRSPQEVHIYEIMTKPVITVPADMDIRYVARLLFHAGIRRAPVEKNGEMIGVISLSSLILDNDLF